MKGRDIVEGNIRTKGNFQAITSSVRKKHLHKDTHHSRSPTSIPLAYTHLTVFAKLSMMPSSLLYFGISHTITYTFQNPGTSTASLRT
jgi:hypothetical protein